MNKWLKIILALAFISIYLLLILYKKEFITPKNESQPSTNSTKNSNLLDEIKLPENDDRVSNLNQNSTAIKNSTVISLYLQENKSVNTLQISKNTKIIWFNRTSKTLTLVNNENKSEQFSVNPNQDYEKIFTESGKYSYSITENPAAVYEITVK